MAVSTASAPLFIRRAISIPASRQSFSQNGPNSSLWKARDVRVTLSTCSLSAWTMRGCL